MKRIINYRKLFGATKVTDLAQLKLTYRSLIKEWHPDKYQDDEVQKAACEAKSKEIIEAYHFLVSISPETHLITATEYEKTTSTCVIDDFSYKGQTLKITFQDNSTYEYFGVPNGVYNKFLNSPTPSRFARRHICYSFAYRNTSKLVSEK